MVKYPWDYKYSSVRYRMNEILEDKLLSNYEPIDKITLNTVIIAKEVNANVKNETYLQGSMLASLDENKKDNYNLNLTTNTLKYEDLSNTTYANDKSTGASLNLGTNSSSVEYKNGISLSKDKTLSTLGKGNIEIKDEENSDDLERLNRDVTNTTKDIYDVDYKKGSIDISLDYNIIKQTSIF